MTGSQGAAPPASPVIHSPFLVQNTLETIMTDASAPAAARVGACRTVLEMTGDIGSRRDARDGERSLDQMSPDELAEATERLQRELTRRYATDAVIEPDGGSSGGSAVAVIDNPQ